jgi:nucleolar complex protein 2
MNDDDDSNSQKMHYSINNPSVYNKLVVTALRYTPVVLQHHIPYKTLPSGKIKPPTQNAKQRTLSKLVLSYFHNIMHLLKQVTDVELQTLALSEGGKIVPYISTSRKALKSYLKVERFKHGEFY